MISSKGRYAVRVMLDLAMQEKGATISLTDIAKRQLISKKYLEAIMRNLVAAHLVEGTRGKNGGYTLVREPANYTIAEILEASEGPLAPVACLQPGAPTCNMAGKCMTLPLWKRYDAMIAAFFTENTLQSVLDESNALV